MIISYILRFMFGPVSVQDSVHVISLHGRQYSCHITQASVKITTWMENDI